MVRAGGRHKDHMAELNLRKASQRCNRTFGDSAAAYHEREVRQPLLVGRQPPAERVAPPPWRQPPAEREVQPETEIHQEILQCSDCRQYKKYEFFTGLSTSGLSRPGGT